jgi:HEAT repeats
MAAADPNESEPYPMTEVDFYLNQARNGEVDAAFHGLIELGDDAIPALQQAYRTESDSAIRALIVEAVWQHRLPATIDFLAVALIDPHPDVWKQALDGLVTLASAESRDVLEAALEHASAGDAEYRDWIREAIGQIDEIVGR